MIEVDRQLEPIQSAKRSYAYFMRALGEEGLPETFELDGNSFSLQQALKHDFYAATGLYLDRTGQKFVLKVGRIVPLFGIPMVWIGRMLCARELRFYAALADLPNVPTVLGRIERTGFVHHYVEGSPLSNCNRIPDDFFEQLGELMDELHRRDIAYVDTNKPQNILIGDDGKPYLIDFQISYDLQTFGNHFASRWLLRRAKREDCYHLLKHKRRFRPDLMTGDELARSKRVSRFIKVHRFVTKPYFIIRRAVFRRWRESGRLLPEGSK